jgi:hypothetical protein
MKADRAEEWLFHFGVMSVQMLCEFTAVAHCKRDMPLADARSFAAS